eukprot:4564770-Pleurochrysis_carterae.AAC.2
MPHPVNANHFLPFYSASSKYLSISSFRERDVTLFKVPLLLSYVWSPFDEHVFIWGSSLMHPAAGSPSRLRDLSPPDELRTNWKNNLYLSIKCLYTSRYAPPPKRVHKPTTNPPRRIASPLLRVVHCRRRRDVALVVCSVALCPSRPRSLCFN